MKRKTILYIAMTLDGYIADEEDQISFLDAYHSVNLAGESYVSLLKRIDTMIMGRKTYDVLNRLVDVWPHSDLMTHVFSSSHHVGNKVIEFIDHDHIKFTHDLINKPGKDIWIVGGGALVTSLLEEDLIDEFQITVIPKLLGKGKPLFPTFNRIIDLDLIETQSESGLLFLIYKRKSYAL